MEANVRGIASRDGDEYRRYVESQLAAYTRIYARLQSADA